MSSNRAQALPGGWFGRLGACVAVLVGLFALPAAAAPLSVPRDDPSAIGQFASVLQEQDGRLEVADAMAAYQAGKFTSGNNPVLNFGIGAKPAWIRFAVDNPGAVPVEQRLAVEIAWLDRVEVYVRHRGETVASHRLGDTRPFAQRPVANRYFVLDHAFGVGASEVFVRVETPDPMVVPITLLSPEASQARQMQQAFSYGIVYGFLLALLAYNAILYLSLRSTRYLFYSLYLAMFVAMNVAYTGHGYAWLWPDSPAWQQWSNPFLMFLYGVSGLVFAISFLDLRVYFPRVRKAVIAFCMGFGLLLATAFLLGSQKLALLVAFSFVFLFTWIMLALGILSVRAGQKPARYFLFAAVAAMVGALLTTLATWGFIPHNSWTFRAVELGMLLDATLLALALGYQFRVGQEERLRAERLAQLDPLTGLNNRRAFYDKTSPLWSQAMRHGHATSVMLLDIDRFKQINDAHGHAHGDAVLKAVAGVLRMAIREEDILARWGGEEFIVLLPETDREKGLALAERLRAAIAGLRVPCEAGATTVTASIGITQAEREHYTLDALIAAADECLFQAKQQGRNQVAGCAAGECSAR